MSQFWSFRALDTFFFRDGISFNQGEVGTVQPTSQFPPSMYTLQGAIRTRLATEHGWKPGHPERWPAWLGTAQSLGNLKLSGPYLRFGSTWLYPLPLLLVGKRNRKQEWQLSRLTPGAFVVCDLGEVRLLELERELDGKTVTGWITREGYDELLAGRTPVGDQLRMPKELWHTEKRTGFARDRFTRVVKENELFGTTHIRPKNGLKIVVRVEGIPSSGQLASPFTVSLGGEGRMAEVVIEQDELDYLPALPPLLAEADKKVRFTVSLLTHASFKNLTDVTKKGLPGIPGTLVTASIGETHGMVGWDLEKQQPRPLTPLIPAGSVWFYEADHTAIPAIQSLHGKWIGERTDYGFGQIVIGHWREKVNAR
jgi:CRISPR-associated protein Cmr3